MAIRQAADYPDNVIDINAAHSIAVGAPGRIRTCAAWLRSPALYPLSYEGVCSPGTRLPSSTAPALRPRLSG